MKKKASTFNASTEDASHEDHTEEVHKVELKRQVPERKLKKNRTVTPETTTENEGAQSVFVPPYLRPPGPGEPHERMWRNKPEYFCDKCKRWRRHKTVGHDQWATANPDANTAATPPGQATQPPPQANNASVAGVLRRTGL